MALTQVHVLGLAMLEYIYQSIETTNTKRFKNQVQELHQKLVEFLGTVLEKTSYTALKDMEATCNQMNYCLQNQQEDTFRIARNKVTDSVVVKDLITYWKTSTETNGKR